MIARATSANALSSRRSTSSRQRVEDQASIQFHADHAGGSGQHLLRLQLQQLRQRLRGGERNVIAASAWRSWHCLR